MRLEKCMDSTLPAQRLRNEVDRLLEPLVGRGATEAQKALSRFAEALAAQTRDAELVVGAF